MLSNYKLYISAVLLAFAIGACNMFGTSPFSSTESSTGIEPVHNTNSSNVEDLVGHTWVMTDQQSSEGKELEYKNEDMYKIEFNADSSYVQGETGCRNEFSGNYNAEDGGSISIDNIFASQRGCPTEDMYEYINILTAEVDRFKVTGDQLKLGFGDQGVFLYSKE